MLIAVYMHTGMQAASDSSSDSDSDEDGRADGTAMQNGQSIPPLQPWRHNSFAKPLGMDYTTPALMLARLG